MNISKKKVLIIALIAVIFTFTVLLWKNGVKIFSLDEIRNYIRSFGKLGAFIYFILFNIKTLVVVFPYSVFVLIGGTLFGTVNGILLSVLCVATTSTIAFWIARLLGKEKMQGFLKGRFTNLGDITADNGFNIILFMRLSCLFPADAFSYAAGLTHVKYTQFITATVIGMLPEVIALTMLGDNIKKPMSKEFFISIGLVVATAVLSILIQKIIKISKRQDA